MILITIAIEPDTERPGNTRMRAEGHAVGDVTPSQTLLSNAVYTALDRIVNEVAERTAQTKAEGFQHFTRPPKGLDHDG